MFDVLVVLSYVLTGAEAIKEKITPIVPAKNWANEELYHQDVMNGVSIEQRMKNLENGKYKQTEKHPKPHRDSVDGKIIIENCKLYNEDLRNYGAVQTYKWVRQGKYNLTPVELKKAREEYQKKLDRLCSY